MSTTQSERKQLEMRIAQLEIVIAQLRAQMKTNMAELNEKRIRLTAEIAGCKVKDVIEYQLTAGLKPGHAITGTLFITRIVPISNQHVQIIGNTMGIHKEKITLTIGPNSGAKILRVIEEA
jgi:hypothetical protein